MAKNKNKNDEVENDEVENDEVENDEVEAPKKGAKMLNKNKSFTMVFVGRLKCYFQKNRIFDPVTCEEMSKKRIAELEG